MARTRNIKPGFFTNEDLGECPPLARLLYAGLWCHADREGRLEERPRRFKVEILPWDDCDIGALLLELEAKGQIVRYEHGGGRYIAIPTFSEHQNPHIKEPASTIPAPGKNRTRTRQAPQATTSPEVPAPVEPGLLPSSFPSPPSSSNGEPASGAGAALEVALNAWNTLAEEIGLARAQRLTKQRRSALSARLEECGGLLGWEAALERVRSSSFLRGENDRGWRADFDFLLQPKSFTKLMEGGYDRADRSQKPTPISDEVGSAVARAVARKRAAERSPAGGESEPPPSSSSGDSESARAPDDGADRGRDWEAARVGPRDGHVGEGAGRGSGGIPRGFENHSGGFARGGDPGSSSGAPVWQPAAAGGGNSSPGAGGNGPQASTADASRDGLEMLGGAGGPAAVSRHAAGAEGEGRRDDRGAEAGLPLVDPLVADHPAFMKRGAVA